MSHLQSYRCVVALFGQTLCVMPLRDVEAQRIFFSGALCPRHERITTQTTSLSHLPSEIKIGVIILLCSLHLAPGQILNESFAINRVEAS